MKLGILISAGFAVALNLGGCTADDDSSDGDTDSGTSGNDTGSRSDNDSGTTSVSAEPGGTCLGDVLPCADIPALLCDNQYGCAVTTDCTGDPTPCSQISDGDNCALQQGCKGVTCWGTAVPCFGLRDDFECSAQWGCMWDSVFEICDGAATPCGFLSANQCESQQGCFLTSINCQGSAVDCEDVAEGQCGFQLGCNADSTCFGDAVPCEDITIARVCFFQEDCDWVWD